MKLFKALWDLLNGKKLQISSIAVIISLLLRQYGGVDVSETDLLANWDLLVEAAGWFLGLGHKIKKTIDARKAGKK